VAADWQIGTGAAKTGVVGSEKSAPANNKTDLTGNDMNILLLIHEIYNGVKCLDGTEIPGTERKRGDDVARTQPIARRQQQENYFWAAYIGTLP
jgi:hypothetical protein